MKKSIINEILLIKKMMGLIVENTDNSNSDLSKFQTLLDLQGLKNIKINDILNDEDPLCGPPQNLDDQKNQIIKDFWNWSNSQTSDILKKSFSEIKNYNNSDDIDFGNFKLTNQNIKELKDTLLSILIIKQDPNKCKK